jgi:hypothetical protein
MVRLAPSGITPQLRQAFASAHEAGTWPIDQRELPASLAGASERRQFAAIAHGGFWHFSDVPAAPTNVRFQGYSGREMLAVTLSHFDPGSILQQGIEPRVCSMI